MKDTHEVLDKLSSQQKWAAYRKWLDPPITKFTYLFFLVLALAKIVTKFKYIVRTYRSLSQWLFVTLREFVAVRNFLKK